MAWRQSATEHWLMDHAPKSARQRQRFGPRVLLVATLGAVLPAGLGLEAGAAHDSLPVNVIDWQRCPDASAPATAECALVTVPLDYDDPTGESIDLAVTRIPALDRVGRIGSVFVNPGGPGSSAVRQVWEYGEGYRRDFDDRFDIVGFDPRGVGRSEPLRCFASESDAIAFDELSPGIFPYEPAALADHFAHEQELATRCLDSNSTIVGHASTADVARDMDLLRDAVGDARLSYVGFSYGTFLGATYAHLFPDNIRVMVLDSALDPRNWSAGTFAQTDSAGEDLVLAEFMRQCDAAAHCALAGPDGAQARWLRLLDRVRQRPIELGPDSIVHYDSLVSHVSALLSDPGTWGDLAGFLDEIERATAAAAAPLRHSAAPRLPWPPETNNSDDADLLVTCADTEFPDELTEWAEGDAVAAHNSLFGPSWWWRTAPCASWPAADDRYDGPWGVTTAAPILVVGTRFDPSTPISGAEGLVDVLGGSRLLTWSGWGHIAYGRDACIERHVRNYLLRVELPAAGTECPAGPNPFDVPAI
jgi:pimeloyl-ACP methyl ester carboxylesterase